MKKTLLVPTIVEQWGLTNKKKNSKKKFTFPEEDERRQESVRKEKLHRRPVWWVPLEKLSY